MLAPFVAVPRSGLPHPSSSAALAVLRRFLLCSEAFLKMCVLVFMELLMIQQQLLLSLHLFSSTMGIWCQESMGSAEID